MRNEGDVMNMPTLASFCLIILIGSVPVRAQTPSSGSPGSPKPVGGLNGASTAKDYRLVAGDKLRIEVYRDPQLSQNLQVRPDGKITLPLIGDVMAAGETPSSLRDTLTTSLREYINNPVVTVIVVEAQPQTISVMGEVNNPGVQPLKYPMSVIDALAIAGGFKDFANTKNILIKRVTPTGVQTIKFNYKDAIKSDGKPMYLQPGDVIIVP
jgi:polysaccharide biosynthesis/export protein